MSGIIAQNTGRHTGLVKAPAGGGGEWTLIKTVTAAGVADISFVDGTSGVTLDTTYDEYCFRFRFIHPEEAATDFQFNLSIDGGSNYNVTKTTTQFLALNAEDDTLTQFTYKTDRDLGQATGDQVLSTDHDDGADGCASGFLYLFDPGSTTFVKHFVGRTNGPNTAYSIDQNVAGYGNTTSAVDAVIFRFDSGEIDAGIISLYGIG